MLFTVNLCSCFLNGIQHAINKPFKGLAFICLMLDYWINLNGNVDFLWTLGIKLKIGTVHHDSNALLVLPLTTFVRFAFKDPLFNPYSIKVQRCCHPNWFRTDMKEIFKSWWKHENVFFEIYSFLAPHAFIKISFEYVDSSSRLQEMKFS